MVTILVIEDEAAIRELLVEQLRYHQFEAIAAENGKQGLGLALSKKPDLILCDEQMPDMDGFTVLKTLHQNADMATVPFIFLTAQTTKATFRQGMDLGADDYLTKPFTQKELLGAIASCLSKRRTITQPLTQALHQAEERVNGLINASPGDRATFSTQIALATALHHALLQGECEVYYQPQVQLATGKIVGVEALVQWHTPQGNILSPADFLPLAEQTDLAMAIGKFLLLSAGSQIVAWKAAGLPLRVSIPLSAPQLLHPQPIQTLRGLLEATDLEPQDLLLEVTEKGLKADATAAATRLQALKSLGIRIALDDFGMGYASLDYLKQFPIDTLIVGRSFVMNVNTDPQNRAIALAVLQLARSLKLTVLAKGIETEAELAFLKLHQCDLIQGPLCGQLQPASELERGLREKQLLFEESLRCLQSASSRPDREYIQTLRYQPSA